MNTTSIQKPITLGSIAESIKGLATHEEVKSLQQQFIDVKTTVIGQTIDFKKHIDGLTLSIDDLPTRSELKALGQHLEGQIDGLAISVNHEFERSSVKLDEMDKHLVMFEEGSERRFSALQNQLDAIHGQYPNRSEHAFLEKRIKRIEKAVFV